jgi:glycosyltransferase involved in cell wall biosynthesis
MKLRAIALAPLPPHSGGGPISRGQILSGLARAGHEICAITPISTDTLKEGDRFAARHPELRVIRYWLPSLTPETRAPVDPEVIELERAQVFRLAKDLVRSYRPNMLIAGREGHAALTRDLAAELGLPWCLWLRGLPTGDIVSGRLSGQAVAPFLDLVRSADLVISVAEYLRVGLEQRYGIAGIRTIPNAVDLEAFRPFSVSPRDRAALRIPDGHTVILMAGVLVPRKRPMDLARAAERVMSVCSNVVFLIAGDGPMQDEMADFCRSRGMIENFRFAGAVAHERMPMLYNAADAIVLASESEGISRIYLEALACGRPILASDIAAAREVIEDGANGFLFPVGDHQALAERLSDILDDDVSRHRVARSARRSVADRTVERSVDMYAREFRALLDRTADQAPPV